MPIRQNILRKGKAPKQNLLGFDVFQEETGVLGDLSTSRFFKISEFPAVLPTGNSSFLIEGSDLLRPNVEIKTELLDSAGNPIFHYAIPNYEKELPARRITIEVYFDDVINGIGSFTVLGELDPEKAVVPTAFQDTYNVRFTAPISINKNIKNTQPIRLYGDPTLTVSEQVKSVVERVPTGGAKTKTITGSVSLNVSTPSTADYGAAGSTTADSTQIEEVGNNQSAYISQNVGEAQSSILGNSAVSSKPYVTYVVEEMEKGIDNALDKITSAMQGGTLSINRPDLLVDASIYPNAKFTKPTTFSTKILNVLNSTTFTTTTQYKIKSKTNDQELIVPLNASSSGTTITHNVVSSTSTENTVFKRSYANMTVGNLRTFSGDTYKAKIYMKEDGSSGEFEKIYETLVESPNELVDQNSTTGFKNIGIFPTQSIVTDFWISSSNTFTATQDDDTLIDGILLSGSTEPNGNSFTFETSQSYDLQKNEVYIVDFDVAFKPQNKVQSDGTTKKDAKLEVFLTGPLVSEAGQEFPLGEVDLGEYDFNKVNTFTKVKQKQISDFLTHNETNTPSGSLGFRLHSGEFVLSDVRLRPFSELNFSPGFFKANVPMPKPTKRGKAYDFVVELFDANNNLAEAVAIADDVVFTGAPQVIGDGSDGVLTGSVFLSNTQDAGIELHGGSAFIKSVGYPGFESASAAGVAGFMMFSGSVSKSLNTSESYDGVGIELISGSAGSGTGDRFLQFRTNAEDEPSVFKVQTDDFYFGKARTIDNAQFISGSNGNVEISSSNFHLDTDGSVTMAGTITAEAGGTIGGFTVNENDLTATNFSLDTSGKRLTIGTGNAVFVADADEGIYLGHANSGSAPFRVNREGDLVATSVTVTGEVNASSGTTATSLTAIGVATGSLNTTTGSLLTASESMQKQFRLVDDNTLNLQNAKGGILSSFSDYAKFFGSASNALVTSSANGTVNYTEINDKGFLVVTGSSTASFFGNTTTIGDTSAQHISIEPDSISIKTADDVTVLSASAAGIVMSGSVTANEGTIGGFTLGSTSLIAGSGTTRVAIDTAAGIHLGNNTFSSAPFRVTRAGALTATSVAITGEVNASSGTTATSITALGIATSSLSGSVEAVNAETGSVRTSLSAVGTATASLNIQSGSFLAHSASMNLHTASVNTTTGSLVSSSTAVITDVADTRAQLVLDNSTAGDQKVNLVNTTGGIMSSFGKGVKFFGSASNALQTSSANTNYSEINPDGMIMVAASETASIFNSGGTTIQGGVATASLNADGLTLISAGVTGSLFTAATSSIFGSSDKHERVELVGTGMKVYENNTQVASFGSSILLPVGNIVIGNTSAQHIDISSDVFAVKNAGTTHVAMGNTDKAALTLNSTNTSDSSSFMAAPSRAVTAASGVTGLKVDSEAIINDLFVTDDTNLGGSELTASSNATTTILNDLRYFGTASQATFESDANVVGNDVVFLHESLYDGGDQENDFGTNITPYRFVGNFKSGGNPAINMRNMRDGTFTIQSNLTKIGTNDRPRDKRHAALFIGVNDDTKTRTTSGDILDHYAFIHAAGNTNEGATSTKFQVDVSGSVIAAGNISAFGSSFLSLSDKRWKTDITTFSGSLDKILQLKPRKFKWIKDNKEDYGFIAQEVEEVLPNLVDETSYVQVGDMTEQDTKPYKSVDYSKLTPYLVDTIQQLTKRIEELEKKVK